MQRDNTKISSFGLALLDAMVLSDLSSQVSQPMRVRFASLIQSIFTKMQTLNIEEQKLLLELLEEDVKWGESIAISKDKLNEMGKSALLEFAEGKTTDLP